MPKLQELKGRFFITIPKGYVEQSKWIKGEEITVSYNERGNIELKKVR